VGVVCEWVCGAQVGEGDVGCHGGGCGVFMIVGEGGERVCERVM
jgi:hypothetical protein